MCRFWKNVAYVACCVFCYWMTLGGITSNIKAYGSEINDVVIAGNEATIDENLEVENETEMDVVFLFEEESNLTSGDDFNDSMADMTVEEDSVDILLEEFYEDESEEWTESDGIISNNESNESFEDSSNSVVSDVEVVLEEDEEELGVETKDASFVFTDEDDVEIDSAIEEGIVETRVPETSSDEDIVEAIDEAVDLDFVFEELVEEEFVEEEFVEEEFVEEEFVEEELVEEELVEEELVEEELVEEEFVEEELVEEEFVEEELVEEELVEESVDLDNVFEDAFEEELVDETIDSESEYIDAFDEELVDETVDLESETTDADDEELAEANIEESIDLDYVFEEDVEAALVSETSEENLLVSVEDLNESVDLDDVFENEIVEETSVPEATEVEFVGDTIEEVEEIEDSVSSNDNPTGELREEVFVPALEEENKQDVDENSFVEIEDGDLSSVEVDNFSSVEVENSPQTIVEVDKDFVVSSEKQAVLATSEWEPVKTSSVENADISETIGSFPTSEDQLWIISTNGSDFYCQVFENNSWRVASVDEFYASDSAALPTVFWAHGFQTDWVKASHSGFVLHSAIDRARLASNVGAACRVVIWKWASERDSLCIRKEAIQKERVADAEGYAMARFIGDMKSDCDVTLIGFSFGARVVGSALQSLATTSCKYMTNRTGCINLILASAACDAGAFDYGIYAQGATLPSGVLNIYNPADGALRFYPVVSETGSCAQGVVPMYGSGFTNAKGNAFNINVNAILRKEHSFRNMIVNIPANLIVDSIF